MNEVSSLILPQAPIATDDGLAGTDIAEGQSPRTASANRVKITLTRLQQCNVGSTPRFCFPDLGHWNQDSSGDLEAKLFSRICEDTNKMNRSERHLKRSRSGYLSGTWLVTIEGLSGHIYHRVELTQRGSRLLATSGNLEIAGTLKMGRVLLQVKIDRICYIFSGRLSHNTIVGVLTAGAERFHFSARRETLSIRAPKLHNFQPTLFHRSLCKMTRPVLRLKSGDSVTTWTVDSVGNDANNRRITLPGNPLTGPFFVEGAVPGDVLVVELQRIWPNRRNAFSTSRLIALESPWSEGKPLEHEVTHWKLDFERKFATLKDTSRKLAGYSIPFAPMLGCIGVAPEGDLPIPSWDAGPYGGNLDCRYVASGTRLLLPVFQPGALLYFGDGHAAQGDGELCGNGLETSMDVQFKVGLLHRIRLKGVCAISAEHLMAFGTGRSLDEAVRCAVMSLSALFKALYRFNSREVACVVGTSLRYDVASISNRFATAVARVSRAELGTCHAALMSEKDQAFEACGGDPLAAIA